MRKSQLQYELEHDRSIREIPFFAPGLYVFVDNPALRTVPDASEEDVERNVTGFIRD